jgi:hypothetical protein
MKNQLEKDFHLLNRHSRGRAMMPKKMQGRKNKREGRRSKVTRKEEKSLKTIIMPLGRSLMLREPFISRCWRIVKGR